MKLDVNISGNIAYDFRGNLVLTGGTKATVIATGFEDGDQWSLTNDYVLQVDEKSGEIDIVASKVGTSTVRIIGSDDVVKYKFDIIVTEAVLLNAGVSVENLS